MYDIEEITKDDFLTKKVNAYMKRNGISRYWLVNHSHLGRTTIYRLLNGYQNGGLKTWLILCNDLGITIDELLKEETDEV